MLRCYTRSVPTEKPRYTFTDTGDLETLLDAAQRRWPEIGDRKALLLRLAEEGGSALRIGGPRLAESQRRARLQVVLERIPSHVDADELLADAAWR